MLHEDTGNDVDAILNHVLFSNTTITEPDSDDGEDNSDNENTEPIIPAPTFCQALDNVKSLIRYSSLHDMSLIQPILDLQTHLEHNHAQSYLSRTSQTKLDRYFPSRLFIYIHIFYLNVQLIINDFSLSSTRKICL